MTPEEGRRHHLQEIADLAQGGVADGDLVTDFDVYPGLETFAVIVANYAVRDGDHLYLTLPKPVFINVPGTDTREGDVFWGLRDKTLGAIIVQLPEGFTDVVLAPKGFVWKAPADAGTVTCTVTQEADPARLIIHYDMDLDAAVISAADYDELLEIQRLLTQPAGRTVILRKTE